MLQAGTGMAWQHAALACAWLPMVKIAVGKASARAHVAVPCSPQQLHHILACHFTPVLAASTHVCDTFRAALSWYPPHACMLLTAAVWEHLNHWPVSRQACLTMVSPCHPHNSPVHDIGHRPVAIEVVSGLCGWFCSGSTALVKGPTSAGWYSHSSTLTTPTYSPWVRRV